MPTRYPSTATFAQRAKEELREYAVLCVYLYICFGALILYKMTILNGMGVSFAPYGLAAIKALILGKFILLGHALRLGERYKERRVVYVIVSKALLYLALLIILSAVEEVVVGLIHGRTVAATLAEHLVGNLPQMLATSFVMLLVLIPYLAFKELADASGGELWKLLLDQRAHAPAKGI